MTEHMTTQLVAEEMQKLVAAFPGNLAAKNPSLLADTYRNGLRGLSGDSVRAAVDICIRTDQYFPRVSRLREAAGEWTKRTSIVLQQRHESAWHTCPICGAEAKPRLITRLVITKPDPDDSRTWHYRLPDGQKIKYGDANSIAKAAAVLPFETVESKGLYMDHRPGAHHIHGESQQYEGAA